MLSEAAVWRDIYRLNFDHDFYEIIWFENSVSENYVEILKSFKDFKDII